MRKTEPYDWRDWACLTALLVGGYVLFVHGLGAYGLWDPWEPKYGQAVRDMLVRGDLITPRFDGEVRWTKPILIYWAMLPFALLFGNNEFTLRLPGGLLAIAGVLVAYHAMRNLRGRRTGMMTACVLGTLPQYVMLARQATPDIYLTVFLGMAMFFFALARFGEKRNGVYYLLFYGAFALAFLAKGMPACVMGLAILIFWSLGFDRRLFVHPKLLWRRFIRTFKRYQVGYALTVVALVAGPWYGMMTYKHGTLFFQRFFWEQNIHRFQSTITGHSGTVEYYFKTLAHGMFPWIVLAPAAVALLFLGRKSAREAKERWYFLSWFVAVFVLFTASATKFPHYLAPIAPPLAALIGYVWHDYLKKNGPPWFGAVFIAAILFSWLPIRDFVFENDRYLMYGFTVKCTIYHFDIKAELKFFFTIWASALLVAALCRKWRPFAAAFVVAVAFAYVVGEAHWLIPSQEPYKTLKRYVNRYQRHRRSGDGLVLFGKRKFSVNYYADNLYEFFGEGDKSAFQRHVKGRDGLYVIIKDEYMRKSNSLFKFLRDESGMTWYLLEDEHPNFDLITNVDLSAETGEDEKPPKPLSEL